MRRALALLGPVVLVTTVGLTLVGGSAGALMQPGIEVTRDTVVDNDYGPIVAQFPAGAVVVPTPSGCGSEEVVPPPPFAATCDRIPLRIEPPTGLANTDDYFVSVEVAWDNPTGQDDIDAYVWDNEQIVKRTENDPEAVGYTQINSSTSADQNPEVVKLFHPDLIDYNIVVINSSGPNLGYSIKAYMTIARGDAIFELLDPSAPTPRAAAPADTKPIDFSADPSATPAGPVLPVAPSLGEVAVLPDDELESDFSASSFEEALAPPEEGLARFANEKPGPASGLAVTLSLVALPLAAGIAAAVILRRRGKLGFNL